MRPIVRMFRYPRERHSPTLQLNEKEDVARARHDAQPRQHCLIRHGAFLDQRVEANGERSAKNLGTDSLTTYMTTAGLSGAERFRSYPHLRHG